MKRTAERLLAPLRSEEIDAPAMLGASILLGLAVLALYLALPVTGIVLAAPALALVAALAILDAS